MCGITGIWGSDDPVLVQEMIDGMRHRGPDAEGIHRDKRGTLGHTRLSIMDPAGGDQPIFSEKRDHSLVANGEIYNFPCIKNGLQGRHRFRTKSDSEAALHLFEETAEDTAAHLDGMFAMAISGPDGLYLARDPVGIKPLYVGRRNRSIVFASELKALAGKAADVREFPPGHWYHSHTGLRRYYSIPEAGRLNGSVEEWASRIRDTLERAVVKRLMSDVPVGAFLSGGLDSSLIAALARRHLRELHTFSVGLEGSRDLDAARRVARHIGSRHHEHVITPREIEERLPEILYHLESFDQDLVRSAVPCYFVSALAARHVKVILTGEGADELFAGYDYYREFSDSGLLQKELRRSIGSLHNVNLQRVDRLTMAHSIEGRVPFLDLEVIELALRVPPELKIRNGVDKWILRRAFGDLLPDDILRREKEQFDEGSGTAELLPLMTQRWMTAGEAQAYADSNPAARLRSDEECVYHTVLSSSFAAPGTVLENVARWADRPSIEANS